VKRPEGRAPGAIGWGAKPIPGFSRVLRSRQCLNRFSGFPASGKPLKRLQFPTDFHTRL